MNKTNKSTPPRRKRRTTMSKRVLIAASTMSHIRNFHLPYIRALRERGYTVSGMVAGESADYPVPFRKSVFSPKNLLNILRIRRILKKERFDAVLVHTSLAAFLVRMAAKTMRRRPVVINTVHGYLFSDGKGLRNRLMLLCEKMCRRVTDYLFVMNREDKAIAEKYRLAKTPPVFFYGMGLPADRLVPESPDDAAALRRQYGLSENDILCLFTGEFSRRKDQLFLIGLLPALPAHIKLCLLGQGAAFIDCRRTAEEYGVSDRVFMPGQIADIAPYYAAADLYLSAAHSEGLPFNILEAMAAGLPIVATDVKGHCDLLRGAEDALLVLPGDRDGFRNAVLQMAERGRRRTAYATLPRYLLPNRLLPNTEMYVAAIEGKEIPHDGE